MSLNSVLQDALVKSEAQFPAEALSIIRAADEELRDRGVGKDALKAGDAFPDAILTDPHGRDFSFRQIIQNRPAVISFYRGGWCPYCNLELKAYQDLLGEITSVGGQLVAVSPEKPDNSLTTIEKNSLAFPVLTDTENKLAKALGIAFELPAELQDLFGRFGMNLPDLNAGTGWALPVPATFVVDGASKIVLADVDPQYTRRLEPARAIEALKTCVVRKQA